jgi:stage II sporulation protein R
MKKRLLKKSVILLLIIVSVPFVINKDISSKAQNNKDAFRLHVIANSDDYKDQKIKYAVRDSVLDITKEDLSKAKTKQDAKEYIDANLKTIENEAKKVLEEYSTDYSLDIMTGNHLFPDKYYGNLFYPKGKYDALKIVLGDGEGQNWWCVMFPPLCVVGFENEDNNDKEETSKVEDEEIEYKSFLAEKYKEIKKVDKNEIKKQVK